MQQALRFRCLMSPSVCCSCFCHPATSPSLQHPPHCNTLPHPSHYDILLHFSHFNPLSGHATDMLPTAGFVHSPHLTYHNLT